MKILLFGGSGVLGQELRKIDALIMSPTHEQVDITDLNQTFKFISDFNPDIVIHAAALTDNRVVEKDPARGIAVNIMGTAKVALVCAQKDIRLVYLSTDYIYKGDRGNYKETDEILPFNYYAWTKLGGECSVRGVKNHLIIRTSFGKDFTYFKAFVDKYSNKDYVDRIAPLIYEAAVSPVTGVLNLGTERKTLFNHASERNPEVKPITLEGSGFYTPSDTSMNLQKWINYKSGAVIKAHNRCRACGGTKLTKYLDLGLMPLPNNLEFTAERARNQERFSLQVLFCEDCYLSQLSVVVAPEKLFSYYTYRSGMSKTYIDHCRQMAVDLKDKLGLNQNSYMIDIAGNDGTLLKEFKEEIGLHVLNVDPASNLTAIAEASGIPSRTEFWSVITAQGYQVDLITATNVFAHVDDVNSFLSACQIALKPHGVLVIEFPYLLNLIENNEYDTIYHEHLSYFMITPVVELCKANGFFSIDVSEQSIHGGTVRLTIYADSTTEFQSLKNYLDKEHSFMSYDVYKKWAGTIKEQIDHFGKKLLKFKKQGNKIAGFAASAKGNTLLNSAQISSDIVSYLVDQTPEKIGKFSPGTGIPIVNMHQLITDPPDYLIILSWNFKDEIMDKLKDIYQGKYIIPIPEFTVI